MVDEKQKVLNEYSGPSGTVKKSPLISIERYTNPVTGDAAKEDTFSSLFDESIVTHKILKLDSTVAFQQSQVYRDSLLSKRCWDYKSQASSNYFFVLNYIASATEDNSAISLRRRLQTYVNETLASISRHDLSSASAVSAPPVFNIDSTVFIGSFTFDFFRDLVAIGGRPALKDSRLRLVLANTATS